MELLILAGVGAVVAWYGIKWYQARNIPDAPPVSGTGNLCSPQTVGTTLWLYSSMGFVAGLPAWPIGAIAGGVGGFLTGIGKVIAAQKQCDAALCANITAGYQAVLTRGQGGGRIAHLLNLVHKARNKSESCNGMTNTAGLIVGA